MANPAGSTCRQTAFDLGVWVDVSKCRGHALGLTHAREAFDFVDLDDRSNVICGAE